MGDRDLPSDSDSSDEDYTPQGVDRVPVSEDESGQESNENEDSEGEIEKKKRKKTASRKKSRKKLKSQEVLKPDEEKKEDEKFVELSVEDKKQKADALWADFLKDCDPPVKKKSLMPSVTQLDCKKEESHKVVQEYEFAGEKVLIEKEVIPSSNGTNASIDNHKKPSPVSTSSRGRPRSGIASILGQMGKKNKLSTLEKSKLDWDSFKKEEGIGEDLERHNKGKNGYLERQDFLERADLRQFEIEKSLRATKRSSLR